MQAGSTRALAALVESLDGVLDGGADPSTLGGELFAVVATLDHEPTLRRVLTEPSVDPAQRAGLAASLLEGKVAAETIQVVQAAVTARWSRTRDLVDAIEHCAIIAVAARAQREGQLDRLEDELFRFGRVLAAEPELRDALSDRSAPLEARTALLDRLVEGKAAPSTIELLHQLLVGRQRSLAAGLLSYQEIAAGRRSRLIATAWVAAPMDEPHRARIAELLAAQYSQDVHLNVIVDERVLGGVRVAIADDVIDSTVDAKMAQAARRLAR